MTTVSVLLKAEDTCEDEEQGESSRESNHCPINMVSGYNCLGKMTDSIALKEKTDNFQIELKNALTGVLNGEQKKTDKEMQYLKELIVSHLDIIQQQSEQLAIKDRIISKLKNEKEMLSMRLMRMERRVNLDRSRGKGEADLSTPQSLDLPPPTPRPLTATATRLPRRSSTEIVANHSKTKLPGLLPSLPQPPLAKKPRRNRHASEEPEGSSSKISNKLITESLYYTSVGEQECRWCIDTHQPSKPSNLLEVPSWRMKTYSSSYTMEGTENLSDEVFERRHTNLHKDEKRRKRWDVQRIREMRHNEKLRQRQIGGQSGVKSEHFTESLWPRPTRSTQLIVQQSVPVAAFGITLQTLPHRDFSFSSFTFPSPKYSKLLRRAKR